MTKANPINGRGAQTQGARLDGGSRSAILPVYTTPEELAVHWGVGERSIREKARELGACYVIGKKMILIEGHVQQLMEAFRPCHSNSNGAAKSGTSAAPLPDGDFEALQGLRTKSSPSGSRSKSRARHGNVVLMDREQG